MIHLQVSNQTGSVSVITQQAPVRLKGQGIDRSGTTTALGQLIGHPVRFFLEGHGDVGAPACLEKRLGKRAEAVQRRQ